MAGGQERELRRRIKSVQSTHKITKAMELIAASQIARAQARIAANRPYREGMARIIVRGRRGRPDRGGHAARHPRAGPRSVVVRRHRRRPRPLGRLQLARCCAPPSTSSSRLRADGRRVDASSPSGKKAISYFRFRGIEVAHSFQGFSDRPTFADAREVAAVAGRRFVARRRSTRSCSSRCASSPRRSQAVEIRQLLPLPDARRRRRRRTSREAAARGLHRVRARRRGAARACSPRAALESEVFTALLEGAAAFHTLPAARDGRGDRERRRAGPLAHPRDEPGPPGRDHDRDHGDRGRRRGAAHSEKEHA